ncbi:EamA family transporter [filamentous cyanobacterium CCP1]|nr:EamA family transporter [filamentous cyanobacterium CCP2]PSB68122.1 EamA family transporter [filamentous cyanobacterium CCP1]
MQLQPKTDFAKSPFFLIAPFFFLATAMVVMKYIIPNTTPLFLAAFRLVPAGILVLMAAALLKLPQPKTWQAWAWIALFALVDGAMFQGLLTTGLVNTGAGIGAVLIDAQPLVVAVLCRFLFADLIGGWGWLGLLIGVMGISFCGLPGAWIYGGLQNIGIPLPFADRLYDGAELTLVPEPLDLSALSLQDLLNSGEFLMLLAALSMSFGTIIVRYVKKYADPLVATGWHMLLGGIPLVVLSTMFETNQITHLQVGDWAGLAYATVFGTAVTYGMFFYLAATGNVTSISALIFLTPAFALLFSNVWLGETLSELQWFGVALTLVSVYLVNQRQEIGNWFANFADRMSAEAIEITQPDILEPAITAIEPASEPLNAAITDGQKADQVSVE